MTPEATALLIFCLFGSVVLGPILLWAIKGRSNTAKMPIFFGIIILPTILYIAWACTVFDGHGGYLQTPAYMVAR